MVSSKGFPKVVSAWVWISMERERLPPDCFDGARRRPVGVFVRGELHDAFEAELTPELFFGLAWLVRVEREDVGGSQGARIQPPPTTLSPS